MTLKNQSDFLFGTKIYNHETKSIGLLIYTWDNTYCSSDGFVDVPFATCVDSNGKKYNTKMDNITPLEDMSEKK